MTPDTKLNIAFKGERTYLTGADILHAVSRYVGSFDKGGYVSRIVFRRPAKYQCSVVFNRPAEALIVANGTCQMEDQTHAFWVSEQTEPITSRSEFDESKIVGLADIAGDTIMLREQVPFSTVEVLVALTKALNTHLSPEVTQKWIFSQYNGRVALPLQFSNASVQRTRFTGQKLSINECLVDARSIGQIRFVWGSI